MAAKCDENDADEVIVSCPSISELSYSSRKKTTMGAKCNDVTEKREKKKERRKGAFPCVSRRSGRLSVTSSRIRLFRNRGQKLQDKKTRDNDHPIKEECERSYIKYVPR